MKAREENGQIKVYRVLPKSFDTGNGVIENFRKASVEVLESLGFYDYERESKVEYQKYGDIVFQDGRYLHLVVDMTPEEITAYEQNQLDEDESASKYDKRIADGTRYYKRFIAKVVRRKDNNSNYSGSDALATILLFNDALQYLKDGLHEVARSQVNQINPTEEFDIQFKQFVKDKLTEYISNNPL